MTAFPLVELGELCRFVSGGTPRRNVAEYFEGNVPWITGVDVTEDIITKARHYITRKAIDSSATNVVPKGNILLVTRTGVGKVAIAGVDICISQDFTGLLPDTTRVDVRFLFYYLRARQEHFVAQQRGATIQGVTREVVAKLKVPLPQLPEQQRIAAILAKADRLRRLRRYARELSDTYLQSVFLEMFGDPVTNPRGWPIVKLNSIGRLDRGRSKNRPRNAPELYGGRYPFVQTGDVANASGYIRAYKQTYSELGLRQSKLWPSGTLCITIAANIAKTAILTFDACFPDSVVGFVPNQKTNVEFVQQWFAFIQENLEETAPESAQKNINLRILRNLDVLLPQRPLQGKFAHIVHQFERLRAQLSEAECQAEHLFQTLLHRAFRGDL